MVDDAWCLYLWTLTPPAAPAYRGAHASPDRHADRVRGRRRVLPVRAMSSRQLWLWVRTILLAALALAALWLLMS
jgi:4-hydroxybenzoate polyprenyltransferase